ncbi:MAG: Ppx/GppA phosphatase family protein [Bauldia sp.]
MFAAVAPRQQASAHAPKRPPNLGEQAPAAPAAESRASSPTVGTPIEASFYGALDLGTNNCRLLIAAPRGRGFRVVDAFSRIVRLGEGVGATGRLSEAAMTRAIAALKNCRDKLVQRGVVRSRLIATEACRAADNGADFLGRVEAETGLALEIVSRETEARLAVAGCASLIDPSAEGAILFDIGGGSTEVVWIDLTPAPGAPRRRTAERIRSWSSLPVGVVSLADRYGGEDVSTEKYEAMVGEVLALIEAFPQKEELGAAVAAGGIHMLGTSGTVTTLAGMHLGLPRYDRRQVDGVWMRDEDVRLMIGRLLCASYVDRVAHPCIGRERADLVLGGCAILDAILRRWPCQRLRVADRGLREGMLIELMAEDGVWHRRSDRASNPNGGERHG